MAPLALHPPDRRERLAEEVADQLDTPVTVLGVVFALVVLADVIAPADSPVRPFLEGASWVLWALFVAEFVLRAWIAPSTGRFLRRNWWQLVFLAVPFLRFLRVLRLARLGRAGRALSSLVRGTRTASRVLSGRVAWLIATTVVVVLGSSQLLYLVGDYTDYAEALHAATLAAVAGEPLAEGNGVATAIGVALVLFSVVVFAALAGALGAFFLERRQEEHPSGEGPRSNASGSWSEGSEPRAGL